VQLAHYLPPGLSVTDCSISVPLVWGDDNSPAIDLFYREVVDVERRHADLPLLVFLQGGPGGKGPRPTLALGWLAEAIKHYRVILPDQRGTGRSTPVDAVDIARFADPAAAANYLSCFLADSIVRDFEHLRTTAYGGQRWASLGQSYGGFLTLAYLSRFPDALRGCYVTGGIPGLPPRAAEVYRRTFPRARAKTEEYYARYPDDVASVAAIADRLAEGDVTFPNGDPFSPSRLQSLGMDFGMKPGFERVHWLVDEAFARPGRLAAAFVHEVFSLTSSAANPLFWTLQEFIYGSGANGPIDWAAQRERDRQPDFAPTARPLLFTAEHTFTWMFDEVAELRPFKPGVEQLMQRQSWPLLYDAERLRANEVPVQAVTYFDDLYVDSGLQLDTLAGVGNSHRWVTNEYEHDGLLDPTVFRRLYRLLAHRGGLRP
jgi:pimeloyl-ACP methyl ester carboxylesterase